MDLLEQRKYPVGGVVVVLQSILSHMAITQSHNKYQNAFKISHKQSYHRLRSLFQLKDGKEFLILLDDIHHRHLRTVLHQKLQHNVHQSFTKEEKLRMAVIVAAEWFKTCTRGIIKQVSVLADNSITISMAHSFHLQTLTTNALSQTHSHLSPFIANNQLDENSDMKNVYCPHLSINEMTLGLKSGLLLKGVIHFQRIHSKQLQYTAHVMIDANHPTVRAQLQTRAQPNERVLINIEGLEDLNRAMHKDVVVIKLKSESSEHLIGVVVGILHRSDQSICGSILNTNNSNNTSNNLKYTLFQSIKNFIF